MQSSTHSSLRCSLRSHASSMLCLMQDHLLHTRSSLCYSDPLPLSQTLHRSRPVFCMTSLLMMRSTSVSGSLLLLSLHWPVSLGLVVQVPEVEPPEAYSYPSESLPVS